MRYVAPNAALQTLEQPSNYILTTEPTPTKVCRDVHIWFAVEVRLCVEVRNCVSIQRAQQPRPSLSGKFFIQSRLSLREANDVFEE